MLNNLIELLGFLCLAVFAWFVWPPLALLVTGLLLVLWANVRGSRARRSDPNARPDLHRVA